MLFKMNLFKRESSIIQGDNTERIAIRASRIYSILLIVSLVVVAIFNGLTTVTVTDTVPLPSIATFEKLYAAYPSTLSCPCQKIAISYDAFLTVAPTYHHVCNAFFIKLYRT